MHESMVGSEPKIETCEVHVSMLMFVCQYANACVCAFSVFECRYILHDTHDMFVCIYV
jgi:hypothetical protein